jgi:hypothetical protein
VQKRHADAYSEGIEAYATKEWVTLDSVVRKRNTTVTLFDMDVAPSMLRLLP